LRFNNGFAHRKYMSKSAANERTRLLPSEDSDSEDGIAPPAGSLNAEPSVVRPRKGRAKEKQPLISKSTKKVQAPAPAPDIEHFAPVRFSSVKFMFIWIVASDSALLRSAKFILAPFGLRFRCSAYILALFTKSLCQKCIYRYLFVF
jgi:hypothetical protein